ENSFVVTINTTPVADVPADVTACDSYTLPALTTGNYYTGTGGTGTMLAVGDAITSTQTLYIYAETGTTPNCFDENSFVVTINTTPIVDAPSDITACNEYALPALTNGTYYTGAGGTGTMLAAGDIITSTQTLYVYAETGTTPNCFAENSFEVTINPLPAVISPTPLIVCDDALQDGFTAIDLRVKDAEITGGNSTYAVSYHLTQTFAEVGTPALGIPYTNESNPQTVYVRVEDTITGCHSTTTLELQVGGAISVTPPSALTFCDPDNDGFGAFDLEQATPEITGGNPDLEVTYHETITNAENNVLPLESPYANIVDYQQTLWVRVEN